MKRLATVALVALIATATASAASRTMTETQAEAWVRAHVVYVNQEGIAYEQKQIADLKAAYEQCVATGGVLETLPDGRTFTTDCNVAKQEWRTELSNWLASGQGHFRSLRSDCRGDSPSSDAYHFSRFRCRVIFRPGWANVRVTVGRRVTWRWLP